MIRKVCLKVLRRVVFGLVHSRRKAPQWHVRLRDLEAHLRPRHQAAQRPRATGRSKCDASCEPSLYRRYVGVCDPQRCHESGLDGLDCSSIVHHAVFACHAARRTRRERQRGRRPRTAHAQKLTHHHPLTSSASCGERERRLRRSCSCLKEKGQSWDTDAHVIRGSYVTVVQSPSEIAISTGDTVPQSRAHVCLPIYLIGIKSPV